MELVEWLLDRLDEEKRDAEAALREAVPVGWFPPDMLPQEPVDWQLRSLPPAVQQHIARNDPRRVLREVEAKRRILDLHEGAHECSTYDRYGLDSIDNCAWVPRGDYCSTVRLLALRFADAPGYRDEWRP
jgi:hypothetical protein